MFAFSQIEPNRYGQISRYDIPLNDWLGIKFEAGKDATAYRAISQFSEDNPVGGGFEISAETANKTLGIPGHLEFTGPITAERASLMNLRKKRELELQAYLNAADHDAISWKGVAGFGAMMAGNISNPLDLATMFLPVVGSAAKSRAAAQAGRGIFRQALARGVVTEESLAMMTKYPRFGAAVIDGTIGNALQEVPVFIQKQRDQADYTLADSALNIAAGGAFAGVLHLGGRGIGAIKSMFERLSPEIKERMVAHEVDAFLKDEPAITEKIARVDETAIAAKVESDLKAEVERNLAVSRPDEPLGINRPAKRDPMLQALDETSFIELYKAAKRHIDTAEKRIDEVADLNDLTPEERSRIGRAQDQWTAASLERFRRNNINIVPEDLFFQMRQLARNIDKDSPYGSENFEKFKILANELARQKASLREATAGISDLPSRLLNDPDFREALHGEAQDIKTLMERMQQESPAVSPQEIDTRTANEREQRIREYIDARKPERIAQAKQAALQAQQKQGKILTPEQIKEFTVAPDEKSIGVINEDAKNIEASLKSDFEARLKDESLTPEQRDLMKERFDKQLAEIEEKLPPDETKAIEQAKNCLLQNG